MSAKHTLRSIFFPAIILASTVVHSVEPAIEPKMADAKPEVIKDSTASSPFISRVEELNKMSTQLVRDARSGKAAASAFRIQATLYREHLRSLMLDDKKNPHIEDRIPQTHLLDLVRMSALIHSASECKTGRYIVCPVDLMTNLASQQQKLSRNYIDLVLTSPGKK